MKGSGARRTVASAAVGLTALLLVTPVAHGGDAPFNILDRCQGTSHDSPRLQVIDEVTGDVIDPFSVRTMGFTIEGAPPGGFLQIDVAPPGGGLSGRATGVFDLGGRAVPDLALFEFGEYEPTFVQILSADGATLATPPPASFFPDRTFVVDSSESVCTRQTLSLPPGFQAPTDGIVRIFESFGATPDEATMVSEWGAIGLDGLRDPVRFSAPSGPPTIEGPFGDIIAVGSSQVTFDGSGDSPIAFDCSTPGVVCGGAAPNLMGGDYHVMWFQSAGPFPPLGEFQSQQAIVFNDSIGAPWAHGSSFPWDTFDGASVWMFVDTPIGGTQPEFTALLSGGSGSSSPLPTDSFGIIGDDTFAVFAPRSEFPAISGVAAASQFHDGRFGSGPTDPSVLDSAPDTNGPWTRGPGDLFAPMPVAEMDHIVTGIPEEVPVVTTTQPAATPEPVAAVTTTSQPASTPQPESAATTTVPAATPPSAPPASTPEDNGGPPWIWIFGGGLVIGGGGLYLVSKNRKEEEEDEQSPDADPSPATGRVYDDDFLLRFFDLEDAEWELDDADRERWFELKNAERTALWLATRQREEDVQKRIEDLIAGYTSAIQPGIAAYSGAVQSYATATSTIINDSSEILTLFNEWHREGGVKDIMWWVDLADAAVGVGRLAISLGAGTTKLVIKALGSADEAVDAGRAVGAVAGATDEVVDAARAGERAGDVGSDAQRIYDGEDFVELDAFIERVLGRSFSSYDEALPAVARELGYYMDLTHLEKTMLMQLATKARLAAKGNPVEFPADFLAWLHRMNQNPDFWENLSRAAALDLDSRVYRILDDVEIALLRQLANSPEAANAARRVPMTPTLPPRTLGGAADAAADGAATVRIPPPGSRGFDPGATVPPPGAPTVRFDPGATVPPPASGTVRFDPALTLPPPPGAATLPGAGALTLPPPAATLRIPPPGAAGAAADSAETLRIPPGGTPGSGGFGSSPASALPRPGEAAATPASLGDISATSARSASEPPTGVMDAVKLGVDAGSSAGSLTGIALDLRLVDGP